MNVIRSAIAAAALAAVLVPVTARAQNPVPRMSRNISIAVNGTQLGPRQNAEIIDGRVYVPLRALAGSLHIPVRTEGAVSELDLPSREHIYLSGNNRAVTVENRRYTLDAPVLSIKGRTFVPAQLFEKAFGAIVRYDTASAHVLIFAHLESRPRAASVAPPVTGTLANVDSNSNPPSVSVLVNGQVRTLILRPGVPITMEDLVAGTLQHATLDDLHPGDLLTVSFSLNGSVAALADSYRSINGKIAAVAPGAMALADGHVVTPTRSTTVRLNGAQVGWNSLSVGDSVTVRSNPETLEVREILASHPVRAADPGPVQIRQLTITPAHPLKAKEELLVFMRGTPGGKARFDLGANAVDIPMEEIAPGLYRGRYLVVQGASFLQSPVIGHLEAGGAAAPAASAASPFSAATLPPQIVDIAPNEGQPVNDTRAAIYATFTTPTGLPVDPNLVHISVNGRDVSAEAKRTRDFVSYRPANDLPLGPVNVALEVTDLAGNTTSYHWSFICGSNP